MLWLLQISSILHSFRRKVEDYCKKGLKTFFQKRPRFKINIFEVFLRGFWFCELKLNQKSNEKYDSTKSFLKQILYRFVIV